MIQCPNSSVTYEFSSTPGDISFGVVFVAAPESQQNVDDLDIETVEEVERVPSGTDCVSGSFDVPAEGVIFFLWDNNFDWSSVKSISYSIRVFQVFSFSIDSLIAYCFWCLQPQFATLDDQRCTFALEHLSSTVEDLNLSLYRHADAQSALDHNSANVAFLEDRIAELEKKLSARKEAIAAVSTQITQSEKQIWMRRQCSSGLCIR